MHSKLINHILYILLIFIFSSPTPAKKIINSELSPNTKVTFDYLKSIYGSKTLAGYNVYGHTPDVYEQVGKHGAIWARDLHWFGNAVDNLKNVKKMGYILTVHWHWAFDDDSAWEAKRTTPVDVYKMITSGTPENTKMLAELKLAADKLQLFKDADIPILWRPLHEIDGGWFWWTDKKSPENTAELWRIMYDYMATERKLDNLIWVYSASVANIKLEKRKKYYPGKDYVDISGIDVYGVDFKKDKKKYIDYFNIMTEVSPGKMLSLAEADGIPNPDFYKTGESPRWLYVLPWWGTPHPKRPVDWASYTMHHEEVITLDELPAFGNDNTEPTLGIISPIDNGSTWFTTSSPEFEIYANDRGGSIQKIELYANENLIETKTEPPYKFDWDKQNVGSYNIKAIATDNSGSTSVSNTVRIVTSKTDIAKDKAVVASSGKTSQNAVDGDIYSYWTADKTDTAWLYIDLEDSYVIDNINLHWGWKIHPEELTIDIAASSPELASSWSTVHTESKIPYTQWKLSQQITFPPVKARFIRITLNKRAGHQYWGGYQLASIEVPIDTNKMPSTTTLFMSKVNSIATNTTWISLALLLLSILFIFKKHIKPQRYPLEGK